MSRAKHPETLHAVQLFPFVAVLLCTMGSLLVLLVSVARSSKDRAATEAVAAQAEARAAAATRAAEAKVKDRAAERELVEIAKFKSQIDTVQTQAVDLLKEDQLRLSHLEDHIRRLQEQLDTLKTRAAELNSLAESRFDSRHQAEQELERLHQLLKERKQSIEQMRKEKKGSRSYAVLPFKTKGGTFRPPVYFECSRNKMTLQPEGIQFTEQDFRGPPGAGCPIAAAFRATRELMVKQNENHDAASEPYALIIVRPEAKILSDLLMTVFDKSGIDFGYEIIESDARITYPVADPQYFAAQTQAVLTARARLDMLASAAPQVYDLETSLSRHYGLASADDFDEADDELVTVEAESSEPKEDRPGRLFASDGAANYEGGGGGIGLISRGTGVGTGVPAGPRYAAALPAGQHSAYGGGSPQSGAGADGGGSRTAEEGTPTVGSPSANSVAIAPQYHDGLIARGTPGDVGSTGLPTAGAGGVSQSGEPGGVGGGGVGGGGVGGGGVGGGGVGGGGVGGGGVGGGGVGGGGVGGGGVGGGGVGGGGVGGGGVGGGGVGGGGVGGGGVGGGGVGGGGVGGGGVSGGGVGGGGVGGGGVGGGGVGGGGVGGGGGPATASQGTSDPNSGNPGAMFGQANAVSVGNTGAAEPAGLPQFGNYNPHALPENRIPPEKPGFSGEDGSGRQIAPSLSDNAGERQIHQTELDDMPVKKTRRKVRGKDWAIRGRTADAVPIRRKIHVLVRGDSLVIRPDASLPPDQRVVSEIPLIGPTGLARDEFADALENRIRSWGMAGQGLYWRPVISLEVSPDGAGRAEELATLLRNSGIELEPATVAQKPEGANANASH